mmetsp:Transcript_20387/g.31091  ORF Transcript_20387/g.31091 Transcript_20387/m.31091 type:complete len:89 (+) Transcript_20387:20-286(+)
MGQRRNASSVVLKDAQTKLMEEECATDMEVGFMHIVTHLQHSEDPDSTPRLLLRFLTRTHAQPVIVSQQMWLSEEKVIAKASDSKSSG